MYGLTNQIGGKIYNSINPVMQIIVNEINKVINYVNINLAEYIPQRYIIIGQGSLLPGLQNYLVGTLGRNFELIDPIINSFSYSEKVKAELIKSTGLGYAVSVGLALKET
jgi:Tfp pilus assembly PilM family ATPase